MSSVLVACLGYDRTKYYPRVQQSFNKTASIDLLMMNMSTTSKWDLSREDIKSAAKDEKVSSLRQVGYCGFVVPWDRGLLAGNLNLDDFRSCYWSTTAIRMKICCSSEFNVSNDSFPVWNNCFRIF